jgi:tripartite-type tricarboxylate transporter receptor subunit TctC
MARLLAQGLSTRLGQNVLVENRPSLLLGGIVSKAPADGYTLLLNSGSLWLLPFLQENVAYDPVRDFSPISITNRAPNVLIVHPSLPVRSVRDLIALAKARPGMLNYAAGPAGTSPHLAAELFKSMASVNILGIHYKGAVGGINDLIGGQVQLMFSTTSVAVPHVMAGRLRGVASTSGVTSVLLPDLPTVAATLPGYKSEAVYGIWAPAKTPMYIVSRLNQEIVNIVTQPDVIEKFFNAGLESVGSSPEQFDAEIKSEMARMGKVIKDAGIRAQ